VLLVRWEQDEPARLAEINASPVDLVKKGNEVNA
jgi:hypothetical protein